MGCAQRKFPLSWNSVSEPGEAEGFLPVGKCAKGLAIIQSVLEVRMVPKKNVSGRLKKQPGSTLSLPASKEAFDLN